METDAIADRKLDPDTTGLLNLLKLGKNERTFRIAVPHLYQNVESSTVEFRNDDDSLATVVRKLHRFPDEDAVLLSAHIENSQKMLLPVAHTRPLAQRVPPGVVRYGETRRLRTSRRSLPPHAR
ncbi:MAG: hypothetical protein R3F19_30365 [Verrucomicrobiales bacterium]